MLNRLISIFFLAFIGISSAVLFFVALAIWLLTVGFDRRLVWLHMFTSFWGSVYVWIMPFWSISLKGRRRMRKGAAYMIVSNHQSQLDILVAFTLFYPFKWVSKSEIFKLPFVGWNMVLNRYIKLKRGDKESIQKMMADCEKKMAEGSSVYFFPEGTRSSSGVMKPFKPGAFILAKKMKVPILPIAINGTKNALPKHSLNFHGRHTIRLEVLDEIPYEVFADMPAEDLGAMVRERIAEHVDEHQKS